MLSSVATAQDLARTLGICVPVFHLGKVNIWFCLRFLFPDPSSAGILSLPRRDLALPISPSPDPESADASVRAL